MQTLMSKRDVNTDKTKSWEDVYKIKDNVRNKGLRNKPRKIIQTNKNIRGRRMNESLIETINELA